MADDVDYPAWILGLGREGRSRAEIARSMHMSLQRLKAWEEADAAIAKAMREAETASQAWWEAEQRDALLEGGRVNAAAWRAAMEWRFGDAKARAKTADRPVLARVNIPDNGRPRRDVARR